MFKRRKRLTTKYNAFDRSLEQMKKFEAKYGINSYDFYAGNCDLSQIEESDRYKWELYINSYILCGGNLEQDKAIEDFIKRNNPYEAAESLGLNLQALARYAKEQGKLPDELTEEEVKKFKTKEQA